MAKQNGNADLVAMLRYGADAVEAASALLINDTDERLRFGTDRIPWTSAELRCEADRLEANP